VPTDHLALPESRIAISSAAALSIAGLLVIRETKNEDFNAAIEAP
jgi:hypothetical protein